MGIEQHEDEGKKAEAPTPSWQKILDQGNAKVNSTLAALASSEKTAEGNLDADQRALKGLIDNPQYRHLQNISYLTTNPYFRIEFRSSKDGQPGNGLLSLVMRGHLDGERDDANSITFFVNNYRLSTLAKPEGMAVPLGGKDTENFFIKYLLEKGYITAHTEPYPNAQLATAIHEIQAVSPTSKDVRNLQEGEKIDQEVGQTYFGIDQGDKKIATHGLANCVGVTLYDPKNHRGAVAHFDPNQHIGSMLNEMLSVFNVEEPSRIEVQLIGGWSGYSERAVFHLRQGLQNRGLSIASEDILGSSVARNIMLDTATGKVTYLKSS